jgi:hypothetical protein
LISFPDESLLFPEPEALDEEFGILPLAAKYLNDQFPLLI